MYRIGDHLPDKAIMHLPSTLTMKSVYDRMKEDFGSQRETVSQPQFYNLWKEYYSHVTIPAVSTKSSVMVYGHHIIKIEFAT